MKHGLIFVTHNFVAIYLQVVCERQILVNLVSSLLLSMETYMFATAIFCLIFQITHWHHLEKYVFAS